MSIDFPTIVQILIAHTAMSQAKTVEYLFNAYMVIHYVDTGSISRWCRGIARVSPDVYTYYRVNGGISALTADVHAKILPRMVDPWGAIEALQPIVSRSHMSNAMRSHLDDLLAADDLATYIATIVYYALAAQRSH